jgi:SAP domain
MTPMTGVRINMSSFRPLTENTKPLKDWLKPELQAELEARGLARSGNKDVLISRLRSAIINASTGGQQPAAGATAGGTAPPGTGTMPPPHQPPPAAPAAAVQPVAATLGDRMLRARVLVPTVQPTNTDAAPAPVLFDRSTAGGTAPPGTGTMPPPHQSPPAAPAAAVQPVAATQDERMLRARVLVPTVQPTNTNAAPAPVLFDRSMFARAF